MKNTRGWEKKKPDAEVTAKHDVADQQQDVEPAWASVGKQQQQQQLLSCRGQGWLNVLLQSAQLMQVSSQHFLPFL